MDWISIIVSLISVVFSIATYIKTFLYERRKSTVECFNTLQENVLDNFVSINKENAILIIDNLDNEDCKKAYDGYRVLIARLEQFAVGVNKSVYDFKVVDTIAGEHFIYLYEKVKPIIDKANEREQEVKYYSNFVYLVEKLNRKYKIKIEGE